MSEIDTGGAARAWTSDEPRWREWRSLVDRGALAEADALADGDAEAIELTRRLRHEWPLDREAILSKVRDELPDATDADLDAWTAAGAIASREVDGERRWFRREPRNLFLHHEPARQRRLAAGRSPDKADRHAAESPIVPHVAAVVAASESTTSRRLLPTRVTFSCTLTLKPNLPGARPGSKVRAWLPFPQDHRQQHDATLIATTPPEHKLAPPGTPQRTVFLQQTIVDPARPTRFDVTAEFKTSAFLARPNTAPAKYDAPTLVDVSERPPHVVFTDQIRAIVAEQSVGANDKVTLARRLWNWVNDHVPWCAEHEYCLLPSISAHALRNRRGDCGTQAMLLISLCRCAGIPARWVSGWTTEPGRAGMHDWAEIWLDDLGGWVPVDPSYGKKRHDDPRVREFYFGGVDAYRMVVNTDYGRPLVPPIAGLRAEPLDFQRGEVELDGRVLYYDAWDYAVEFEHEPLPAFGQEKHAGTGDRRSRGRR